MVSSNHTRCMFWVFCDDDFASLHELFVERPDLVLLTGNPEVLVDFVEAGHGYFVRVCVQGKVQISWDRLHLWIPLVGLDEWRGWY